VRYERRAKMFNYPYFIELLTPKRSTDKLKDMMNSFAKRYRQIIDSGSGVSIPDNPMGQPRYSAIEAIDMCGLSVQPEKLVMNLNTFHGKDELDDRLKAAADKGIKYLLVIRGDGGPALPKLDPKSIGGHLNIATSVDLLRYINLEYAGAFVTGAAFNQYNRASLEAERLKKKIDAGASFVITQPVIGKDPNVDLLKDFNIPIVIEAWMSRNVDLLYRSVRKEKENGAEEYDPVENLGILHKAYPESSIYLSMLSFKEEWKTILPKL